MPLARRDGLLSSSWDVDHPQPRIAAFVGDKRDAAAVPRPARRGGVELTVGQREGIPALARHQPELMPLPTEIRAVDDARTVRRPVRPRLPRRLFVAQLAQRRAGARLHPPEPAGAVEVAAIGDEDDL